MDKEKYITCKDCGEKSSQEKGMINRCLKCKEARIEYFRMQAEIKKETK
jgi:predicted Zn-ribbon and HTH transcriptional regulator